MECYRKSSGRPHLGAGVGDELGRVEIVAVEGGAAGIAIAARTGAERLSEVEPHVDGVADLLDRALRQQVDVLVVRVVVVLGRLGQRRARPFRQPDPRLKSETPWLLTFP